MLQFTFQQKKYHVLICQDELKIFLQFFTQT